MITDLSEIRRLTDLKQAENVDFRRHLNSHHYPIEPFRILAREVEQQIDCTTCANCCRYTLVSVGEAEIERIAKYLRIPGKDVVRQYTEPDPEAPNRRILLNRNDACVFLDGNLCMIYEARPTVCREFPYTALRSRSLGGRISSLCRSAAICPIVFNALERYKKLIGYRAARS